MCYKIYSTHSLKAMANIPDEAYTEYGFLDAPASFETLWTSLESYILESSVIRKLASRKSGATRCVSHTPLSSKY